MANTFTKPETEGKILQAESNFLIFEFRCGDILSWEG